MEIFFFVVAGSMVATMKLRRANKKMRQEDEAQVVATITPLEEYDTDDLLSAHG